MLGIPEPTTSIPGNILVVDVMAVMWALATAIVPIVVMEVFGLFTELTPLKGVTITVIVLELTKTCPVFTAINSKVAVPAAPKT